MQKYIFYLVTALFSVSCSHYPVGVEQTLKFAGDNRAELEKVLLYYSQNEVDSLKYKAACFLIGNMRYHHGKNNKILDTFRQYTLSVTRTQQTYHDFQKKYGPLRNYYDITYDAHVITADYLIRNIEFSFRLWEEMPWGKHYPFDIFCEEILPYRVGHEPIEDWKEAYHNRYRAILDTAHYDHNSPLAAWRVIFEYLRSKNGEPLLEWVFANDWSTPNLGALSLLDLRYGTCQEQTDMFVYVMRSLGIPCGIDMMVQHPDNYDKQHWWNYMRDTSGLCVAFDFYYALEEPDEKLTCIHKNGVPYRKCFSLQKESFLMEYHKNDVYIPASLNELFLKNVGRFYFDENPVTLPAGKAHKNGDVLFLSVFNNTTWVPITWDEVRNGFVTFRYLEPDVLYQLTYFSGEGNYHPVSDPFILFQDGAVFMAEADNALLQDMRLSRKFRFPWWWYVYGENVIGGKFQFANKPDFNDAVTVHTITSAAMRYIDIHINQPQSFKYARYLSAPEGCNMMAEVQFFSGDTQLQGTVIGTDGSYQDSPDNTKYSVFDGNTLTYFISIETSDTWSGLEFDEPQHISRIRYWFRYDDNTIREGDNYELFYWDKNSWVSAGQQIAVDTLLCYPQIPSGTLYWLRNHTRGKEERPFTYDNGEQIWW